MNSAVVVAAFINALVGLFVGFQLGRLHDKWKNKRENKDE